MISTVSLVQDKHYYLFRVLMDFFKSLSVVVFKFMLKYIFLLYLKCTPNALEIHMLQAKNITKTKT